MGTGANTVFSCEIASFATLSSAIDLGGHWQFMNLVVPSMTSNTALRLQASDSLTGTYRIVKHPTINSSTVATNDYVIASSATNCIVPIPNGLRYVKVEATAVVSFTASFKIICGN